MDIEKLRGRAKALEDLLARYAPGQPDLERCRRELDPVFRAIEKPGFAPPDRAPCAHFFGEGGFEPWPDLSEAYSSFYVSLLDLEGVNVPE